MTLGKPELVSLGLGYDEETDDYKVVRIVCRCGRKMKVGIEVYSTKSDSRKTINVGSRFKVVSTKSDAVVGGNPYWIAKVDKNVSDESHIVWFDVKETVCKIVVSSNLELGEEGSVLPLMDWKGSLAVVLCNEISVRLGFIHVLVFDMDKKMWNTSNVFVPGEMIKLNRCLQCSKSGVIKHVKVVEVDGAQMMSLQIHEYDESLVAIDGMEPVKREEEDEVGLAGHLKSYLQIQRSGIVRNYPSRIE